MPKIEDVKRYCEELEKISMTDTGGSVARITLAAIEDAQRYKKDENRYELGMGKYGAYFHDTETGEDLPLEDVLHLLNTRANNAAVRAVLEVTGGG